MNLQTYDCPTTEFSHEFLQGMVKRMVTSYHKYGAVKDAYPHKLDAIRSAKKRLDEYAKSGNTEDLIDAANFLMIEFMQPSHEDAHFAPTDSDKSPGRVTWGGRGVTHRSNSDL